jgi:lipooligosaccharide transport system permease protein
VTGAVHVYQQNVLRYRHIWRGGIVLFFLSPILFLAAMGFGLGGFVDRANPGALAGLSYATFLAPGLLAAQAMQTASFESTYPIMGRIVWNRIYHGILATPLSVHDIIIGEFGWIATRLALGSTIFFGVMVAFGLVSSPFAILGIPAAVLTGLAFAGPIVAFTGTQRTDNGFNGIFRFIITPLFLFSGTFFPISQLPSFLQPVAWVTPLFHGVSLTRGLSLGTLDPAAGLLHVAVLVAFGLGGVVVAGVTFRRALVK